MNKTSKFIDHGILTLLATAMFTLSGCAIESPKKPIGIEQKIQSAHTRAEHEEIASEYEKQAEVDKTTAKAHQNMAQTYRYYSGPKSTNPGAIASHCNNLAKLYQQAAEENIELAKLHRQLAADIK